MEGHESDDIPLVGKEEAIAEVRRWLEVENVDPERIFTAMGDRAIRYKDLISHLEQETADGDLLRFAISRGRSMKRERSRTWQDLLQIAPEAHTQKGGGGPPPSESPGGSPPGG
jgi:hypothetical protein